MASSGGSEKPSSPPAAHRSGARLALISVSDKTGVTDFARGIAAHGYELLSTGGTARLLREAGLEVTEVSDYTGSPEIMDGRVKTLHPRIHGGLLGREGIDDELMAQQLIRRIHLLVLNLYPFEEVTSRPGCSLDEAVEHIDIGGPALLRSAAKNFRSVAVVSAPEQYADVLQGLDAGNGTLDEATRYRLAVRAFQHVARYDEAIGSFLSGRDAEGRAQPFPPALRLRFTKLQDLRYGENPHQQAAWYRDPRPAPGSLAMLRQIQGKELSFNNIADADAAWACVGQFDAPACVIVKHANPCGAAVAGSALQAYERAYATDATSAFGGVIALNRKIAGDCAKAIIGRQFVELLIAPGYSKDALKALSGKPGVRVLQIPPGPSGEGMDFRRVGGGLLVQTRDGDAIGRADCRVASARRPGDEQWEDLLFAWKIARMVKSNAIVYARDGRTLGIGAGQMSRIDSVRIATWKAGDAGLSLGGAAMASDAFFPFRDGIDAAAGAGIASVIQPGGSKRDEEVIAAADEHGMALVFTGIRHFRH